MKRLLVLALSVLSLTPVALSQSIDLDGAGWSFRSTLDFQPHAVSVPHCWLVEKGYERYIGHGIYERDFDVPSFDSSKIARLHFDAVYDTAQVWVNGVHVGTHEGGYTAFEFDVTKALHAGKNHILLDVDNTPTISSIPALATGNPSTTPEKERRITIVGWLPYGGIVRPVRLVIGDPVFFKNVKIDSEPDLQSGVATLKIHAVLHNGGANAQTRQIKGTVAGLDVAFKSASVPAGKDTDVTWTAKLPAAHLWSVRDPFLYDAKLTIPGDEYATHIGIRKIQVQGTKLLLNGHEVHLYGANRVGEDEKEGLRESDAIIERDMSDMLADNMRMMRIAHYPQSQALLDFADKHGMLIIPEAGNWNMSAWQMADPEIRARFQKQQQEMVEQEWNHPSLIAWSVGNEYESYTKEGIAWTRDMKAFTLSLDPTRLITFASRYTSDAAVKTGADEASQWTDFVSINVYGDYARHFDRAHQLYPDKPVFVTEFGKMGESELHDPQRIADITDAVTAMKERPWMIGGSLWTWNDYKSFIRGTPEDGIRRWGVVNLQREHRESWKVVQDLFKTELP